MTRRAAAVALCAALAGSAGAVGFNDVAPGARAMGMGNAFAALADDAYGMYYNPAGSANTPYLQAAGSLGRLDSPRGPLTQGSAAYLRPYEPVNTATIGASYDFVRQTQGRSIDSVLFNYAQEMTIRSVPLSKPLKVGGNFKFINADSGGGGKFGMGLDFGALARTEMGLTMGAALTDLTSDVGLPRAGITLASAYQWQRRLTVAADFRAKGGLAEFYPGVEATFHQGLLRVRAGRGLRLDGTGTVNFGVGVNFSPVILDVAMSLPAAGVNRAGGGYQATLHYRFGAPSFAGQFVGQAAATAEALRTQILALEDRKKTLQQETDGAETNRGAASGELRALEKRVREAQDQYRALLKRNEELDYRAAERSAAERPGAKPTELPKAPVIRAPAWPKRHTVKAGDTLRSIAGRYYGDPNLWEKIFEANRAKVDRGLPAEGAVLVIPPPKP